MWGVHYEKTSQRARQFMAGLTPGQGDILFTAIRPQAKSDGESPKTFSLHEMYSGYTEIGATRDTPFISNADTTAGGLLQMESAEDMCSCPLEQLIATAEKYSPSGLVVCGIYLPLAEEAQKIKQFKEHSGLESPMRMAVYALDNMDSCTPPQRELLTLKILRAWR